MLTCTWITWMAVHTISGSEIITVHLELNSVYLGVRCGSVVRVFTHGVSAHWIDSSWSTHSAISCSSQYSSICVTKTVLSCLLGGTYKRTLVANWKE